MTAMDMEHTLTMQVGSTIRGQLAQMDKQVSQLPPAMRAAFQDALAEVDTAVQTGIDYHAYAHEIALAYADLYNRAELDQLFAFYASPLGQRMLANQAELMVRSDRSASAHAAELMPKIRAILTKRMSAAKATGGGKDSGATKDNGATDESLGKPFSGFTSTTIDGKPFTLEPWKGKVVVVDFWATWCGPCRGEMPNVKALYSKQHAVGLEIVGVSLDEDRQAVIHYLAKEQIPWTQVFDGKGWENAVAQQFGIHSIPATFLIGRDGTLIAKGLRGEELSDAVAKALAGGPATGNARTGNVRPVGDRPAAPAVP